MLSRRHLIATLPALAFGQTRKFARSFHYIQPDSKLVLVDIVFGSDKKGWAMGGTISAGRVKGTMLSTLDGGASWQSSELKFIPRSIFPLDDSSLWAVSERGEVWFSAESGRDWKKLSRQDGAFKVHFINNQTGFLVGAKKTLMRTEDGGKTWRHVPEAAQVTGSADSFSYKNVDIWNGKLGIATGSADRVSKRTRRVELPDWMEPEMATFKTSEPHVMVTLQTKDAGKTWIKQEVVGFGYVDRTLIGTDGAGVMLIKFDRSFDYGGEIYTFFPNQSKKGERILREKNLYYQDIAYVPGDGLYLACTERLGILPVPTKVRIKHTKDFANWTDISVDYRAVAKNVTLSATPSGKVFAALDQGTILALQ